MQKKAILLLNLGSPKSTKTSDVRKYLNEFLMDGKVIDIPYLLRLLLVRGIISPLRAPQSAKKYKTIWTESGSPLVVITEKLTKQVEDFSGYPCYFSMRYTSHAPIDVMHQILKDHPQLEELILLPLYPHYAMSSYETGVEYAVKAYRKAGFGFDLKIVPPFYNQSHYIKALSERIKPHLDTPYDQVLFSYHGIPERHVRKTDITKKHCLQLENCCSIDSEAHNYCYRHQVIETTNLVAKELNLSKDKFSFSFQSRLGADAWLKPYTGKRLSELPGEGIKNLVIVCPAFVSDCLETLEEIHEEGRETFIEAGGDSFTLVPCLNNEMSWIKTIDSLLETAV